jgi:hypothetical protein
MDCIVSAYEFANEGRNIELRGAGASVFSIEPRKIPWDIHDGWKQSQMWACREEDIPAVVDVVSKAHPGKLIGIYKLNAAFQRGVGELKSLTVTEEGVLPF